MKFGIRIPSLKKRISARISIKRVIRHRLGLKMPKGTGILTHPKKAIYNKIYNKTSVSVDALLNKLSQTTNSKPVGVTEQTFEISNNTDSKVEEILNEHFRLWELIKISYRDRNRPEMLVKAIEICKEQIAIAPQAIQAFMKKYPWQPLPAHGGYEQLAIILEKQGKLKEAIELCNQAMSQGWNGEWQKRIARYNR